VLALLYRYRVQARCTASSRRQDAGCAAEGPQRPAQRAGCAFPPYTDATSGPDLACMRWLGCATCHEHASAQRRARCRWTPPKSCGRRTARSGSTPCTGIDKAGGLRPPAGGLVSVALGMALKGAHAQDHAARECVNRSECFAHPVCFGFWGLMSVCMAAPPGCRFWHVSVAGLPGGGGAEDCM